MAMYIQDSAPARRVAAWVIVDKRGRVLSKVQALYPADGAGRLRVEVRNSRTEDMLAVPYFRKQAESFDADKLEDWQRDNADKWAAYELWGFQRGSAGGCGYDKLAAALSGLVVAGHTMADHCGHVPEDENKRKRLMARYQREYASHDYSYWRKAAERIGCSWANPNRDTGAFESLYFESGLRRLETLGLTVVQAI